MPPMRWLAPLLVAATLAGCTPRPESNPPPIHLDCNPAGAACLLPFPSSVFEVVDASTASGLRVDLPEAASFAGLKGSYDWEQPDGFSAIGSIAAYLPDGGTASDLPIDYAAAMQPTAVVAIVDADATSPTWGERVPLKAEIVESEQGGGLLVLTPLAAFLPSGRYAVVVSTALRDAAGEPLQPTEEMAGLLGTGPIPEGLEELATYYEDLVVLARLGLGWKPADIAMMWDFHVRSDEEVTADLRSMAAQGAAWLEQNPPDPQISDGYPANSRTRYDVTFDVPLWRDHRFDPLHRDADGAPEPVGTYEIQAYLLVPDSVTADNPATPLLFGHGLGVNADQMQPTIASLDLDSGPFVALAFDWDLHGHRGEDLADIIEITGSMNFEAFAAAMLQSSIDMLVGIEVARRLPDLPDRPGALLEGPGLYLGQSMGSLVGVLGASISTDLTAGVLNVGGGGLANILRHGEIVDVIGMRAALEQLVEAEPPADFPADLGYDVLLVAGQPGLDRGDPMMFAQHIFEDRLVDGPAPTVLLQESMGDGIMPNICSEALARRMGLTLVEPAQLGAPGLDRAQAPTCGDPATGLTQFTTSDIPFQAHLALEDDLVQAQATTWLSSYIDDDPSNDGNIAFVSLSFETDCD